MSLTLAFRNLFHDRVRLAVTLIGILFSIVLVAVQLGLYLGARGMIIAMIDRADGDLWIMAYGTKNFEEAQPIRARDRYVALATPDVERATPLVTAFTDWRKPTGGSTLVVVIGSLPPGGLAHVRYLCKRLRGSASQLRILAARLGFRGDRDTLRPPLVEAGADEVTVSLAETHQRLAAWYSTMAQEPTAESGRPCGPHLLPTRPLSHT